MNIVWPAREWVKDVCCITMVKDEPNFIRQWLLHYRENFSDPSFIIIDHASVPSVADFLSSEGLGENVSVLHLPAIPFDDDFKSAALTAMSGVALGGYKYVITSDSDELVIPLPSGKGRSLSDLIDAESADYIAPIGVEFIHNSEEEAVFDFGRPLLEQRNYVRFHSAYSKPVIWKHNDATFGAGQHRVSLPYEFSKTLGLAHLKYVDVAFSRQRQNSRGLVDFSASQIEKRRDTIWAESGGDNWAEGTFQEARNIDLRASAGQVFQDFVLQLEARLDDQGEPIKRGQAHNLRIRSKVVKFEDF
ncbi:hypothetical protein D2N39_22130 [Gemmobacter lutimaris]|uniref:Glycosyltransferase family 2 protein n=1 Tax=Gemmobacter lutimaris TaxID=2306023 RepID=A0A398BGW3_9RHOB|nr:glycosyltransferase family 2 protein [Gemmobacter lutimaris]RID89649.1 hypothetical protein D2N39_22130 [Gemmobacter lutimaris]